MVHLHLENRPMPTYMYRGYKISVGGQLWMHFSSGFMSDTVSNWGYNTKIIAMIIENRFEWPTEQRNTTFYVIQEF